MIQNFLANNTDVIGAVIAAVIAINLMLSGAQKLLEIVKDKTATDSDNKAHAVLLKVTGFLTKAVEWISANRQNK